MMDLFFAFERLAKGALLSWKKTATDGRRNGGTQTGQALIEGVVWLALVVGVLGVSLQSFQRQQRIYRQTLEKQQDPLAPANALKP
jgi:hypothetical protein